ncbi:lipocalin-like domain-containing protein [Yinghuangia soli]|uniref:Lipocalin-like domain-containing protein n=1 Tax=Yinghuangia soli TaxID=2908204 RepID=A0AA41Q001_9ACTN|nr:lipocalin-like domain-containing protein [Yinghuangia soli]MCF2528712.1 lipocalin-like domain-containing protein [Yinghuangia soli]
MQPLGERIIGAWRLESYTVQGIDGEVRAPLGGDADGFIIYTADGHVSAQLMARSRPDYASGNWLGGTSEEHHTAAAGYLAYSGTYTVDEETQTVRHHIAVSLFPNWVGETQVRLVQQEDDGLVLFPATEPGPQAQTIAWRRVAGAPGEAGR